MATPELTVNAELSAAVRVSPLVRVAVITTPLSALVYVTPLIVTLLVPEPDTVPPLPLTDIVVSPKDGARVKSPVTVVFGLKGMGVAPAGVKSDNTGHHHLLVDTDAPADMSAPLPATDKILHFGKGQTEASIPLSPGKHTLQLLLGDQNHVPHSPPVISKKITVTVMP